MWIVLSLLLSSPIRTDYDLLIVNTFWDGQGGRRTKLIICRGHTDRWWKVVAVVDQSQDLFVIRCGGSRIVYWKVAPGNRPMAEYLITVGSVLEVVGWSVEDRLGELGWDEELWSYRRPITPFLVHDQ